MLDRSHGRESMAEMALLLKNKKKKVRRICTADHEEMQMDRNKCEVR